MICPKCGNDMGNSMYCNNCNTYPFKEKEPFQWKSTLKIFVITIGCFVMLFAVIMGVLEISSKQKSNKQINAEYEDIYAEYENEEYYSALSQIDSFKKRHGDNKKMMNKISDLSNDIESELYNKIKSASMALSECNTYLEFYPDGKYSKEVNELLTAFSEKQAVLDIGEARKAINNNEFVKADSLLQSIIDNTKVSESTKNQAREVLKPIENQVLAEKGKTKILGTWHKATGVSYTFEADGHMSTNLSSNYNQSAGTAGDGLEVRMLLGDIEDFGRCAHGGTWSYVRSEKNDEDTYYYYNLFYNGSMHSCIISESKGALGVILSSGFGEMSVLTK